MPFRITPEDASLKATLRRIMSERGDRASGKLATLPPDEAVHALRKDARKLRAVLRLARPGMADFKSANGRLRDAARTLSGHRDAAVRVETFEALIDHYADELNRRAFAGLRSALHREARAADRGTGADLDAMVAALEETARRSGEWDIRGKGRDLLREGLARTLRRGHAALEAAERDPTPERLHKLRKRAKDHRAQMRLLRPAWSQMIGAREKTAKRLATLIGDHHDLDALCGFVAERALPRDETARDALCALAARRQGELVAQAMPPARRLFGEAPDEVAARIVETWRQWRRETKDRR
ncbi:CHAD domain-containing protein [Limimaricola sp. G21655-S1]|uniref:CHAD domain-containing protein n=1 Tax=Limimaricola sp. G21655-S1 TaxID=3014768 RepID=UPI0022AF97E1|nr:CHAD domain-containing protein [Limimaricola sp. G21655-S1]MCZ4262285.1 CHAD domain-containing protein [Limimaricola sp. G21655-S1]